MLLPDPKQMGAVSRDTSLCVLEGPPACPVVAREWWSSSVGSDMGWRSRGARPAGGGQRPRKGTACQAPRWSRRLLTWLTAAFFRPSGEPSSLLPAEGSLVPAWQQALLCSWINSCSSGRLLSPLCPFLLSCRLSVRVKIRAGQPSFCACSIGALSCSPLQPGLPPGCRAWGNSFCGAPVCLNPQISTSAECWQRRLVIL